MSDSARTKKHEKKWLSHFINIDMGTYINGKIMNKLCRKHFRTALCVCVFVFNSAVEMR